MEFIFVYVEIDDNGNPVYKDEFLNTCAQNCTILASKEYVNLLEKPNPNVVEIPEDVMEEYDRNLDSRGKRQIMMEINDNSLMENWLSYVFRDNNERISGIVIKNEYASVLKVAQVNQKAALVDKNSDDNGADSEKKYRMIIDDLNHRVEVLQMDLKQREEAIETLRNSLNSSNNYIENLQKHATNLDNDLKKYKQFYDENSETIQFAEEKVTRAECEIQKYVELYKNILKELDEKKTELLEMKKKTEKH